MSLKMFGPMVVGILSLLHFNSAAGQFSAKGSEQAKEIQKVHAKMAELQRLTTDAKLAKELELTADQRRKIQIAAQKFTDAMAKARRSNKSGNFDLERFKQEAENLMFAAEETLTAKQTAKLSALVKERVAKTPKMPTQDEMQEMQKLSSMMSELQRLSFDPQLSEKLGLTVEQKVRIREASQKMQKAMLASTNQGQPFDMNAFNQVIGDLMIDAQDILTPEQAEQLSGIAKLKRFKQRFGDEFAMINGLAEEFDLDPNETKKLRDEIREAREDYYEKLSELREDTLERIVQELPPERREEVREAVHRLFEADPMK